VNPSSARALVPPRPNLGPEPWSESGASALYLGLGGTLAGLLIGWFLWNRLRRARAGRTVFDLSSQDPRDNSPRGRLVALSQSVRDLLANQFGPAWRAKTNEELSAEPRLVELLGHDQLLELVRFLDLIDRLKFAPNRSNHDHESFEQQFTAWEPRFAEFREKIQAKPTRRLNNAAVPSSPRYSRLEAGLAGNIDAINK
jgi:hypothetical protein